jgi:hypothetical protein
MRRIVTIILISIVLFCVWNLTKASPINDVKDKWEYGLVSCFGYPTLKKTIWTYSPNDAIPDVNSVVKGLESKPNITDALNAMGNYGWELVAVRREGDKETIIDTYYFKRHK